MNKEMPVLGSHRLSIFLSLQEISANSISVKQTKPDQWYIVTILSTLQCSVYFTK